MFLYTFPATGFRMKVEGYDLIGSPHFRDTASVSGARSSHCMWKSCVWSTWCKVNQRILCVCWQASRKGCVVGQLPCQSRCFFSVKVCGFLLRLLMKHSRLSSKESETQRDSEKETCTEGGWDRERGRETRTRETVQAVFAKLEV